MVEKNVFDIWKITHAIYVFHFHEFGLLLGYIFYNSLNAI